jgi:hypothetical protein
VVHPHAERTRGGGYSNGRNGSKFGRVKWTDQQNISKMVTENLGHSSLRWIPLQNLSCSDLKRDEIKFPSQRILM